MATFSFHPSWSIIKSDGGNNALLATLILVSILILFEKSPRKLNCHRGFYKSWKYVLILRWCGNWWCLEFLNIFDGFWIQKVSTEWIRFYRRLWNWKGWEMFRNVKRLDGVEKRKSGWRHFMKVSSEKRKGDFLGLKRWSLHRKSVSLLFRIIVCNSNV